MSRSPHITSPGRALRDLDGASRTWRTTDQDHQITEILNISASQTYALVRSGDLQGIQIGGRNQWRVERVKLEEFIEEAYRRTAANLADLPAAPPEDS